jgi:hypothetical protein
VVSDRWPVESKARGSKATRAKSRLYVDAKKS